MPVGVTGGASAFPMRVNPPRGLPAAAGGQADQFAEDAIEMCERLKTNLVCNLADPQIRVEQKVPGFLDADT